MTVIPLHPESRVPVFREAHLPQAVEGQLVARFIGGRDKWTGKASDLRQVTAGAARQRAHIDESVGLAEVSLTSHVSLRNP